MKLIYGPNWAAGLDPKDDIVDIQSIIISDNTSLEKMLEILSKNPVKLLVSHEFTSLLGKISKKNSSEYKPILTGLFDGVSYSKSTKSSGTIIIERVNGF